MKLLLRDTVARRAIICSCIGLLCTLAAMAQGTTGKIDTGDTAWMFVSTALVLLMTPGLALFYGGMVRRKNVLGTMMQSFMAMSVISLQWVIVGYSLAFGPSMGHVIGSLAWVGLNHVGMIPNADYADSIPHLVFMAFQMMFAVITPALIFGGVAERMKFKSFLIFLILWATLVYDPLAHWVWNCNGWLNKMGALDFAGGLVVHISAGVTALVAALMLGKRRGYPDEPMPPHNLPLTVLRRRPALVRLVRLQCRQRLPRQRAGGLRLREYQYRDRRRLAGLGDRGMDAPWQADHAGRRFRRGGRPGGHYPGLRLRSPLGLHYHRAGRGQHLLRRSQRALQAGL